MKWLFENFIRLWRVRITETDIWFDFAHHSRLLHRPLAATRPDCKCDHIFIYQPKLESYLLFVRCIAEAEQQAKPKQPGILSPEMYLILFYLIISYLYGKIHFR